MVVLLELRFLLQRVVLPFPVFIGNHPLEAFVLLEDANTSISDHPDEVVKKQNGKYLMVPSETSQAFDASVFWIEHHHLFVLELKAEESIDMEDVSL